MDARNPAVFVSTTFLPDDSRIGRALEVCVHEGIRCVELGSNHAYEPNPIEILQRFELQYLVHNYFPPPQHSFVVNLASLDDEVYKMSLSHVDRAMKLCQEIGGRLYTFHPGFLSDPSGPSRGGPTYDFAFPDDPQYRYPYEAGYARMLDAIRHIVERASRLGVRVAVETEGSISKRDHLLLQRPDEYQPLLAAFSPDDLGINLNIGHLRLASKAFGFSPATLVDALADYIVAMELSHNEGVTDDHQPLRDGAWYWDLIADSRFAAAYKVLEFRNTSVAEVTRSLALVAQVRASPAPGPM